MSNKAVYRDQSEMGSALVGIAVYADHRPEVQVCIDVHSAGNAHSLTYLYLTVAELDSLAEQLTLAADVLRVNEPVPEAVQA